MIETIRDATRSWRDLTLAPGRSPACEPSARLLDIRAVVEPGDADEVTLRIRGTAITYQAGRRQLSCPGKSAEVGLADRKPELTILVDVCSLELLANGGEVSTAFHVAYPHEDRSLGPRTSGGTARIPSLDVHELRSIWA